FQAVGAYTVDPSPSAIAIGDLDADNNQDIVVTTECSLTRCVTGRVNILMGMGNGNFEPGFSYDVGSFPYAVVVGDLNQDGKPDLAVSNNGLSFDSKGSVTVFLGDGSGSFQAGIQYAVGGTTYGLGIGDFNEDNKQDLGVLITGVT